jgi:hypothetical protein
MKKKREKHENQKPGQTIQSVDLLATVMDAGHFVLVPYQNTAVCLCLTKKLLIWHYPPISELSAYLLAFTL